MTYSWYSLNITQTQELKRLGGSGLPGWSLLGARSCMKNNLRLEEGLKQAPFLYLVRYSIYTGKLETANKHLKEVKTAPIKKIKIKNVGHLCFYMKTCDFFYDIYFKSCKPFRAALMPTGVLQPKCLVVSVRNKDNIIWMLDATAQAALKADSLCSKWERWLQTGLPEQTEKQTSHLWGNGQYLSFFLSICFSLEKIKQNNKQ